MNRLLEKSFAVVGKVIFPRRQRWEQRRDAKIFIYVVLFTLIASAVRDGTPWNAKDFPEMKAEAA